MSKRKLMELVERDFVAGWDDPRMPTISGLRRRGVSPAAIQSFITEVGVTKIDSTNDWALLEHHIRQDLNRHAPRAMAVLAVALSHRKLGCRPRVVRFRADQSRRS